VRRSDSKHEQQEQHIDAQQICCHH
jgi:hypothetical protein